jgi:hypothetical protein
LAGISESGARVPERRGFHPDSLSFETREPNWQRGLKQTAAVVCDLLTAAELPAAAPFPSRCCRKHPSPNCSVMRHLLTSPSNLCELSKETPVKELLSETAVRGTLYRRHR